jgi:hypothetical protein
MLALGRPKRCVWQISGHKTGHVLFKLGPVSFSVVARGIAIKNFLEEVDATFFRDEPFQIRIFQMT